VSSALPNLCSVETAVKIQTPTVVTASLIASLRSHHGEPCYCRDYAYTCVRSEVQLVLEQTGIVIERLDQDKLTADAKMFEYYSHPT
jgi:hypothetical protein